MRYTSKRLGGTPPRLVGRLPKDYVQELQEFLENLFQKTTGGIPPGFNDVVPEPVQAGTGAEVGSAGTEGTGWAAANHDHVAATGTPVALTPSSVNGEGGATTLARSDHTHDTSALIGESMIWAIIFGGK